MTNDKCDWPKCKNDSEILYQQNDKDKQKSMCMEHWHTFCDMQEKGQENKARQKLGLGEIKRSNYNVTNKQENMNQQNIKIETVSIDIPTEEKTKKCVTNDTSNSQNKEQPKENVQDKIVENATAVKKTKKIKGIPRGFL